MWAIVNEQSQTNKYIQFRDGYMAEYFASDLLTVADGLIWHSSEDDFINSKSKKYRLDSDGNLFLEGKIAGKLIIDGDKMKYGKVDAVAVTGFSEDWYSTIVTGVSNNQIYADLLAQEFTFDLSVTNPIPNSSVTLSVSPAGSATASILPDNKCKVALPESKTNSKATITFSYPGAANVMVDVIRSASSFISVSKTDWAYEYNSQNVSIPCTLANPLAGASVAAELITPVSWIKGLSTDGSSVKFSIDANNDLSVSSRMASIKLSANRCQDVILNITQMGKNYAVDLGLSVKWAACNLGATSREEYGGYYQWAGTKDVTSTSIYLVMSNCPYHTGSSYSSGWTKYIPSGKSSYWSGSGSPDNKTVLDAEDDVAQVKLGGKWRMPTREEWDELRNTSNCSWTWTSINGIDGYKVQSKKPGYTGNWIFLPAAGYRNYDSLSGVGYNGDYWSSSLSADSPNGAYGLYFNSNYVSTPSNNRFFGKSVRPVSD